MLTEEAAEVCQAQVITLRQGSQLVLRTETVGVAAKPFQALGIALPRVLRNAECSATTPEPCPSVADFTRFRVRKCRRGG